MIENDNIIFYWKTRQSVRAAIEKRGSVATGSSYRGRAGGILAQYQHETVEGLQRIIKNGYQPERTMQTGLGGIEVNTPWVRDRKKEGAKFNSALLPPCLKRTKISKSYSHASISEGFQQVICDPL